MTTTPRPTTWPELIDAWEAAEHIARRSEATLRKRRKHLAVFLAAFAATAPDEVTAADLAAWFRAQDWQPSTAQTYRATLRGLYSYGLRAGLLMTDPAAYLSRVRDAPARPLGSRGPLPVPAPEAWAGPMRLYARHLRAIGRSRETLRLRLEQLHRIARALDPLEPYAATFDDLVDYLASIEVAPETRRSLRSTLRSFYAWALDEGHMDHDPAARLPIVRGGLAQARPAAEDAVRFAIITAPPRERLMVRLSAEVGLRRAEVATVHTRDLIEDGGGWSLLVHGKGQRDRLVPLPAGLAAELRDLPPGWAFPSSQTATHLSPSVVGKLVRQYLPAGVTMHQLRHRFATRAYEIDRDVFAVQQLLGHASPETTRRYVALGRDHLRHTVDALAARTTTALVAR